MAPLLPIPGPPPHCREAPVLALGTLGTQQFSFCVFHQKLTFLQCRPGHLLECGSDQVIVLFRNVGGSCPLMTQDLTLFYSFPSSPQSLCSSPLQTFQAAQNGPTQLCHTFSLSVSPPVKSHSPLSPPPDSQERSFPCHQFRGK